MQVTYFVCKWCMCASDVIFVCVSDVPAEMKAAMCRLMWLMLCSISIQWPVEPIFLRKVNLRWIKLFHSLCVGWATSRFSYDCLGVKSWLQKKILCFTTWSLHSQWNGDWWQSRPKKIEPNGQNLSTCFIQTLTCWTAACQPCNVKPLSFHLS